MTLDWNQLFAVAALFVLVGVLVALVMAVTIGFVIHRAAVRWTTRITGPGFSGNSELELVPGSSTPSSTPSSETDRRPQLTEFAIALSPGLDPMGRRVNTEPLAALSDPRQWSALTPVRRCSVCAAVRRALATTTKKAQTLFRD